MPESGDEGLAGPEATGAVFNVPTMPATEFGYNQPGCLPRVYSPEDARRKGDANSETEEAFDLLRRAVILLRQRDKSSTAAGVKSEMQRLSAGGFGHTWFGFETFRTFLIAAEKQGSVELSRPEPGSGQDVLVSLPGEPTVPRAPAPPRTGRIRSDLWGAFLDWTPGWTRLWDRVEGHPVRFPSEPRPLEPQDYVTLRALVLAEPNRFCPIPVIDETQQFRWMAEFLNGLDPTSTAKNVLQVALDQEQRAKAFSAAVRTLPDVAEMWKQYRFTSVYRVIDDWMTANGVRTEILTAKSSQPRHGTAVVDTPGMGSAWAVRSRVPTTGVRGRPSTNDAVTRQRILTALERMPLSELLRLRIPIEYTLEQ